MDHDTSDILGQKTMPRSNGRPGTAPSFTMTQAVFASMFIVAVFVVGRRLWRRVLIWRETSLRLATRRRHGIPDSDHRPFNVAYNDAMTKARDDESRKPSRPRQSFRPQAPILLQPESAQEQQGLRNRTVTPHLGVAPIPGRYSAATYGPGYYNQPRVAQETVIGGFPQTKDDSKNGLARHGGYVNIQESDNDGKKRGFDQEQLEEHESKKSRVEGEEMMDGDEDAEFEDLAPKRGSKRGIHDEDNEHADNKKSRGKRLRKVSLDKSPQNHDMDVDVDEEEADEKADEVTELKSTTRGKKRDRTAAGSTFGGDDGDSADEPEADGEALTRRRRKRRTVLKRKSEASHARGKKRDRDDEGDVSEGASEDHSPEKQLTHKKGKRSSHGGHRDRTAESDISMEDSFTTKNKVREIGDEWESNGVKYKIGPNGQRLRQALVKKARQKFIMPKDSQHPDRDVNLQVCIETWLTEEEYQEAKAQHNLAWQDDPEKKEAQKLSLEISPETTPVPSGPLAGKNLLWSTTSTPTGSPVPQTPPPEASRPRGYRHSLGAASLAINPFTESQIPTAKRIASNARSLGLSSSFIGSPGLSDSTNGSSRTPHKVLSKWEKQELEARAMMKIREANKKKEQEEEAKRQVERERAEHLANEQQRLNKERLEKERAEKEKADKAKAEQEQKAKEASASAFKMPSIPPSSAAAPPSSSSGAAPIPTPGASSFFSVPTSGSAPGASLFSVPPKAPSTSSGQPSSTNGFSFANPAQSSSNSSAPPASTASHPAAASSGFSFANPSTANPAPGPAAVPVPAATSGFSFGAPKKDGESSTATNSSNSGGPALLSRLGPQVSEPLKAASQPASNTFSFAKPPATSSSTGTTSQNPFGQPASGSSSAPANGATSSSTPSNGGSGLKFSFNMPNKSTTTSTSNGPASSLSGALGSDTQKTATGGSAAASAPMPAPTSGASLFSFKTPAAPASATNNAAGTSSTAPATSTSTSGNAAPSGGLKFNFGTSAFGTQGSTMANKEPAKSGFGAPSTFGTTASNTSSAFGNNNTNTSSAFGNNNATSSAFGNNTNTSSAFGTNNNTSSAFGSTKPSAFGNTNTMSAFGNTNTSSAFGSSAGSGPSPFGATAAQTSSVFGGGAAAPADSSAKPAEPSGASKPSFSFGTPGSTSTPSSNNKSSFSFGSNTQTPASGAASTTPASTPASGTGGFSFNFGNTATPPTATATTPHQPASLFSATATTTPGQSAFGNLTNNTSGTSNVFGGGAFGAPAQAK